MFDWCQHNELRLWLEEYADSIAQDWKRDGKFALPAEVEWEAARQLWDELHAPWQQEWWHHRAEGYAAVLRDHFVQCGVLVKVEPWQMFPREHAAHGRTFGPLTRHRWHITRAGTFYAFAGWPA